MRKSTGLALLGLGLVWAMAGGEARTAAAKPLESAEEQGPGAIVMRFVQQGSRTEFLKELQAAVAAHADRWYEKEFPSLIAALEHEPPAPSGYEQSPEKRSPEQAIRVWVYDLRDPAAAARFPGRNRLDPMEHLVAAGPAAMDALVPHSTTIPPPGSWETKSGRVSPSSCGAAIRPWVASSKSPASRSSAAPRAAADTSTTTPSAPPSPPTSTPGGRKPRASPRPTASASNSRSGSRTPP
jgi:hypothetical protein